MPRPLWRSGDAAASRPASTSISACARGEGRARRETAEERHDPAVGAQRIAVAVPDADHRRRDPDVGPRDAGDHALKPSRRHAHDRERLAVQREGPAGDLRIGVELASPEIVANHRHGMAIGHFVLTGQEEPPELRLEPERGEIVRGHDAAEDLGGLRPGRELQRRGGIVRGELRYGARAIAVVPVVGHRDREREPLGAMRERLVHFDQAGGVLDGERAEEQRADEADDRGRGADAEPQRHHGEESEPARPRQHSGAMLHVAPQPHGSLLSPIVSGRPPIAAVGLIPLRSIEIPQRIDPRQLRISLHRSGSAAWLRI